MNKVILRGNLCNDIELRYSKNNKPVLQNTIAVKNDYKNANGEYESQFIKIVVWNNNAEFLNKYASKGSNLLIDGSLSVRNYDDKDGKKVYVTEIIVDRVEILSNPVKNGQNANIQQDKDPYEEMGFEVKESDLPF